MGVALATIKPGPETVVACARAASTNALSEAAIAAAADVLWQSAKQGLGNITTRSSADSLRNDDDFAGGMCNTAGNTKFGVRGINAWLDLPSPPFLPPWRLPHTVKEREHTGFTWSGGKHVHISEDGLVARHLDDTGDVMHGVVLSTLP